jgi:hypothetical protein
MTKDAAAEKYRKKPVVIEAFHYTGMGDAFGLGEWAQQRGVFYWDDNNVLHVKTLEGEHIASEGDWIIKGVAGEFYPCKPDIFEKTYEPASQFKESQPTEVERMKAALDACFGVMMQFTSMGKGKFGVSVSLADILEARRRAEIMYYEAIKSPDSTPNK